MKSDTISSGQELAEKPLRTPAEVLDAFVPWWRGRQSVEIDDHPGVVIVNVREDHR